jgi:hypothetical protein
MMKITFTMKPHEGKTPKHSTRFDFEAVESAEIGGARLTGIDPSFKPSFYIPLPVGRGAKQIRVTIEEL